MYLPVEKTAFTGQDIKTHKPIPGGNEKILLVDDEEMIIQMEKQMLERLGYHVTGSEPAV